MTISKSDAAAAVANARATRGETAADATNAAFKAAQKAYVAAKDAATAKEPNR